MALALSLQDFEFRRLWVWHRKGGQRFARLERFGMPKIPEDAVHSAFFLYRTVEDAEAGSDPQGSGFFVIHVDTTNAGVRSLYAVSCWHIAVESPAASVIGYVSVVGERAVLPFRAEDWLYIDGMDAAIAPVQADIPARGIPSEMFLTQADLAFHEIDVGEDVFMMGLFADHDRVPAARFGNISVMPHPDAKLDQPNCSDGRPAFVLDMHSRSGFSGSPVFVFRTFGSDLNFDPKLHFELEWDERWRNPGIVFKFLGMHFAQFPELWDVADAFPHAETKKPLLTDGKVIEGVSGMTCAIPAWEIAKLFDLKELVEMRKAEAAKASKRKGPKPEKADNPEHKADFKRLLAAAVKPPKSFDQK